MKLSLAWIFDHIDVEPGSWRQFDVAMIARRFNEVTAEIEHVEERSQNLSTFFLVFKDEEQRIGSRIAVRDDSVWSVDETGDFIALPQRQKSDFIDENQQHVAYLVKKTAQGYVWATLNDFGVESEKLVPAVYAPENVHKGAWKKLWEATDYIIEVDNKSITHRPDMWGHRGFAREIAPFVGKKLRQASQFLQDYPIKRVAGNSSSASDASFIIKNEEPSLCKTFNGLVVPSIENRPCDIKILGRLLAVGARPMSGIVDLTNYVTLDWGQPVHAYDAVKITNRTVKIRKAVVGEELLLLDGNKISLTIDDLVIADDRKPMCLAGVKGGVHDSVSPSTTAIFFEAANFEPSTVRRSALRHKTRTDSSARFEKTLDPNLALEAVQRFLALAKNTNLSLTTEPNIVALGAVAQPKIITIEHAFLEKRMGIALEPTQIKALLEPLEFGVAYDGAGKYTVTVPTFRASKDVAIQEDILEEVVRTYGFAKIPLVLPAMARKPVSVVPLMRHRAIKRYLAYAAGYVEMQNYALFDEAFLRSIDLVQVSPVNLLNPVSENFARLITSLVPGLLKNVVENQVHQNELRFFESGRIWRDIDGRIEERKSLAVCVVAKRTLIDFYTVKEAVTSLLVSLGFDKELFTWAQVKTPQSPWYKPYQTASIAINGQIVGIMGKGNPLLLAKLGMQEEIDAAFAELDLELILGMELPVKRFTPLPKYQETFLDFSFMVPLAVQAVALAQELKKASPLVQRVELIDFFEKESWDNQRSLTFRVWVVDSEGTIDKATLDNVWQLAASRTEKLGAVLRTA